MEARAGAAKIEAIPATNELILAATHAPSGALALFHLKLAPGRAHVTVRSSDAAASAAALNAALAAIPGP